MPTRSLGRMSKILYAVRYYGTLQLIDNRTKTIVADGKCSSFLVDGKGIPTYSELVQDDAALLKEELQAAAEFCIDDYRTRILGLYGNDPPPEAR